MQVNEGGSIESPSLKNNLGFKFESFVPPYEIPGSATDISYGSFSYLHSVRNCWNTCSLDAICNSDVAAFCLFNLWRPEHNFVLGIRI